ncbi:glutamate--tRNA ligase [Parvimonas micra]|uniref:glutamate--tRNA ligase n=1 Tax=Parvimonas micra TaxID=33033 RepID=UPI002B482EBA|nr:glutamate--tRNA ligase [Parvimonas micra]MEB3060537.1 glutamate--tRNA ligase [Parvimonas micra]MEB3066394.1 glutamate--tRNA ligase [Parvimonas micra]
MVRLRFAPSPTGYLHIGGLRTALYNYLYAKQKGGKFLLRIEDTDRTRYVEGAIENLIHELKWAGVEADEGVCLDENGKITEVGECGPYIQSERVEKGIYNKYAEELIENGYAYYCFCSKERLDDVKNQQKADGKIPRYDGLCRGVSIEDAKKRIANGESYVIRLKLPENRDIVFEDVIKGKITINTNDMDDQVLIKADGFPTYHFAVVVDDHLMGITHIVRGDEWISSTPKHIYLYEALGFEKPIFVHLPTVLNKSGKKLSKRNDDASVEDFRLKGYLPEALINYLALVGWSPESNEEILSLDEMVKQFSFDRVSKSGGVFDVDKLDWVNAQYIRKMEVSELAKLVKPYLVKAGFIKEDICEKRLELITKTFQESISRLPEIVEQSRFLFEDVAVEPDALKMRNVEYIEILKEKMKEELSQIEEMDEETAKGFMKKVQKASGFKGKDLYMPVRALLTGQVHGPELSNILEILGKGEILRRL